MPAILGNIIVIAVLIAVVVKFSLSTSTEKLL